MKIWIHQGDEQLGPFSLDRLKSLNITPDTPVWYAGLTRWMKASEAPVTAAIFANSDVDSVDEDTPHETHEGAHTPPEPAEVVGQEIFVAGPQQPAMQPAGYNCDTASGQNQPKKPANYLWLSILLTVLCCNPLAIIAIILAFRVNNQYYKGNFEGAEKTSEALQWCIAISIVLMLMFTPLSIVMGL